MLAPPPTPPVAFPHPLITEVLYAVPTEKAARGDLSRCDANKDGTRDATGDEFVELFNPHDRPIQLKGYTLSDAEAPVRSPAPAKPGDAGAKGPPKDPPKRSPPYVRFAFPEFELKPGEVVVVFNGHKQTWTGPVGDTYKAPAGRNDRFDGAWVFTMRATNSRAGFSNGGDFVLLSAPDGAPVECVRWGTPGAPPPADTGLVEDVPGAPGSSVQRDGLTARFVAHTDLDGLPFSPGRFRVENPPKEPAPQPAAEPPAPAK